MILLMRGPAVAALLILFASSALAVDGPNLVVNGGFDQNVSNWNPVGTMLGWSNGSGRIVIQGPQAQVPGDIRQCIAISGLTAGRTYKWGGKIFLPPNQAVGGIGSMYLVWVREMTGFNRCDGHVRADFGGATGIVGQWNSIHAPEVMAPQGAIGAQISFQVQPSASSSTGTYSVLVDDAYLYETNVPPPSVTIDGPGSGSTGDPLTFEARPANCRPTANGWTWTATGGANIFGRSTRTAYVVWPTAGTFTVTASNSSCSQATASRTVTIAVPRADLVAIGMPRGIVQVVGTGRGTDTVTVRNRGGQPTQVTLTSDPAFATVSPAQFDLPPGAQRLVTITAAAKSAGAYTTAIGVTGTNGVQTVSVPLRILAVNPPPGAVSAAPGRRRVDVAAGPGQNPSGTVTFTNSGSATLTGMLVPSVSWLKPQEGIITIPPGETITATFTTDRAQRYESEQFLGSTAGEISLVFPSGTSNARVGTHGTTPTSVSTVTVVDTVRSPVTSGTIPALGSSIALFLAGVGHVQGSVGLFTTDLSLVAKSGLQLVDAMKMYYTPAAGGAAAIVDVPALPSGSSASFADFVALLFRRDGEVGTLQIRTTSAADLAAAAAVFNVSNAAGTYGTALPLLRSDRSLIAGESLALAGLRADANAHTNLYVQETSGNQASVQTEFYDASGVVQSSRTDTVAPFGLLQLGQAVPAGAVSALVTNSGSSAGRVNAYATPVDRLSGDTWTMADWRLLNQYSYDEPVVIPIAGAARGANNTYFRTDVAIMNTATTPSTATVRYVPRDAAPVERTITINGRSTATYTDIVNSLFNVTIDSVGFVLITPAPASSLTVGSRTYTTVIGGAATFGTGVPVVAVSSTLQAGDLRRVAGIEDAALATVLAARPATFRSNLGLMEVSGQPATVRVTLRFMYPLGKVTASGVASKDYELNGNQFVLTSLTRDILGAGRDEIGDLKNLVIEIAVTGGEGRVAFFVSSVDNGTGDTVLRTE